MKRLVSAKEIAKEFGISYQAVNSYTDFGLIDVVSRKRRVRMYDYDDVKARLIKIFKWIDEGYTLRLIHKMLKGAS